MCDYGATRLATGTVDSLVHRDRLDSLVPGFLREYSDVARRRGGLSGAVRNCTDEEGNFAAQGAAAHTARADMDLNISESRT